MLVELIDCLPLTNAYLLFFYSLHSVPPILYDVNHRLKKQELICRYCSHLDPEANRRFSCLTVANASIFIWFNCMHVSLQQMCREKSCFSKRKHQSIFSWHKESKLFDTVVILPLLDRQTSCTYSRFTTGNSNWNSQSMYSRFRHTSGLVIRTRGESSTWWCRTIASLE